MAVITRSQRAKMNIDINKLCKKPNANSKLKFYLYKWHYGSITRT